MTTTAETPDRVLARKVSSRVVRMNSKAAEFESLIFLVVEHFAAQALHQAQNDKLEEAARLCDGVTEHLSAGRQQTHASPYFAAKIRALKSED